MIAFLVFKPLWPLALPLATYPIWLSTLQILWKYDQKAYMQERQVMSSTMTTEVFINNEKAKDEALDVIASPWC
jgi:hypothetical protein